MTFIARALGETKTIRLGPALETRLPEKNEHVGRRLDQRLGPKICERDPPEATAIAISSS